jgi:hypothetical protein
MAWTYTPRTGTTASGGSPWTTGYSIALSDVFAIQDDIQTWGGDVNAGGHKLTNCAGVQGAGTAAVTVGSASVQITGNFGVGVTPAVVLDVNGPLTLGGVVQQWRVFSGVTAQMRAHGSTAWPEFGTATNHGLHFMTNAATQMTLDASGKLGIGTISPTSPLHVVLATYASDAAAGSAGLTAGAFYKDSSGGVHTKL